MSEINISMEGGTSKRLLTAGKYCDRDIVVTATGGAEDLNAVLTEQGALIDELKEVLQGKAAGGGGNLGSFTQYAKVIARPESNTSFTIENPLGGIAKYVSVIMTPYELTSRRRCRKYVADSNLGIAVGEYSDTESSVLYTSKLTTGTAGNGTFAITEGQIVLYRYNSANVWESNSEYEVEIYQ